jgi:hypothetical protein
MRQRSKDPVKPNPGHYLVKLVPKGWAVPAYISIDQDGRYDIWIDGAPAGVFAADDLADAFVGWLSAERQSPVVSLLLRGVPTDEATYDHRLTMKAWALENAPQHPCLTPMKAIDFRLLRPEDL